MAGCASDTRNLSSGRALAYIQPGIVLCLLGVWSPAQVQADPAVTGQWSATQSWQVVAIHTSLLPTGKVMYWDGGGGDPSTNTTPRLWDPATDLIISTTQIGYNSFCTGHSLLADGRLLVTGGHIANDVGLPNVSAYDPYTASWTRYADMNAGRWYPTNTALANGDVLVTSGEIDANTGLNPLPQVRDAANGTWRDLTNAQLVIPYYSWMYLAPNGRVFNAGPSNLTRYLDTSGTGSWTVVGNTNFPLGREEGSSVMYDDGKILIVGGHDPPTNSAEVIDLNAPSPSWRSVAPMTYPRRHHNATLLPDGKVLVTGGTSGSGFDNETTPVLTPELWDPATETWTLLASSQVPRLYHSTALLLPDGRVLTAGSGDYGAPPVANRPDVEFFSPPYLFQGARPVITTVPAQVTYGQAFSVQTPDTAGITNVTWLRLGSVTHSINQNQRINRLNFTTLSGSLNVTSPASANLAPPGDYILFILNSNGVPSIGQIVRLVSASGPPPSSSPYGGTPRAIPGRIQAEDFDVGGEGVAYHDTEAANNGGAYRPSEGVDIQATTDTGGGYNVGWMRAGEWMQYTVNVQAAGTYTLAARVAANGTGGTFHVEVNGIDKTGPLTIPNTGGWQQWQTITKTGVNLAAGAQIVRLVLDTNGPINVVGNVNYIDVTLVSLAANTLAVTGFPATITAGTPSSVTVTAKDPKGHTVTKYTGTVHFTSSDAQGSLPANYTFVAGDNGAHIFTNGVMLKTAGTQSITATDTVATAILGTESGITVSPASFTKLQVLMPGETPARGSASGKTGTATAQTGGTPFTVTVNAVDASWNVINTVTDTIQITASDVAAVLPVNAALVAGTNTFNVTLTTAGTATVTASDATDNSKAANTSPSIAVKGAFTKLQVLVPGETAAPGSASGKTGTPAAQTAETPFTITVNAVDANWNLVNTVTDPIQITATDAAAVLPANAALVAGTKTFSVTLKTAGTATLTATDVTDGTKSGNTSPSIPVSPGGVSTLAVTDFPAAVAAGTAGSVTVTAKDAYGNAATAYTGTVHLTSSDGQASLPANYTFVAGDSGAHTFTNVVTFKTAGTQTLTATDTMTGTITGTQGGITVGAGAFTKLLLLAPGETAAPGSATGKSGAPTAESAGIAFSVTVNAVDANWNLVNTVTDTIRITANDAAAVLPANAALAGGTKTFTVTLKTAGAQSATASDLTDGTKTASVVSIAVNGTSPYGGTARAIPGRIEAEDFDVGGEGVAYHDLDGTNNGAQYRLTEGVDIEVTSDSGGGYNVGWTLAGEWLQYTVNVQTAGTYALAVRVAANGTGGTFHVEVNGIDKTGPLTIPNTGGWQQWQTITKTGVSLSAGVQVLRLVMDTNGPIGIGNLNYLDVLAAGGSSSPYGGTARAIPGRIEAEDFDAGGEGVAYHDLDGTNNGAQYRLTEGVDIEVTSDSGGGYNVGWTLAGEWLQYTVNVTAAGTYTLSARVSSSGAGGTFHVEFGGVDKTGPLTIPDTGGWQQWQTITKTGVSLSAGVQVLRLVMDANGPIGFVGNLNYLDVLAAGGSSSPYGGTARAIPGRIQAEDFDTGGEGVAYHDLDAANNGAQYRLTEGVDIQVTSDSGGGYNVGWTSAGEWLQYTVNVQTAGTYTLAVRVAAAGQGGTFHVEVNGSNKTGPLTIPNTGGWQQWQTITKTGVSLSAGVQVLRLVMDANGPIGFVGNLNYLDVAP